MNELTVTPVQQQIELAKTLAPSGLLPEAFKGNPANLVYAIQYADALGLPAIHAITGINVIKGKPTASADLMAAVVRNVGHKPRVTASDTEATAVLIRKDDPTFEYKAVWTIEKAKNAGLADNANYKKHPSAMLRARAISEVVRMGASDALFGIEAAEGFEDMIEAEPQKTTRTVSRKKKPAPAPEPEPVEEAIPVTVATVMPSEAQVKKMWALLREQVAEEMQREFMVDTIGRGFESSKELTRDEVATIITRLEEMGK